VDFAGIRDGMQLLRKYAKVKTKLQPHQKRVVDRITKEDQPGLLIAHELGSGKTLTSIAALDALGKPSVVVAPASLIKNYEKELKKHTTGGTPNPDLLSLQKVTVSGQPPVEEVLVVDEAHRIRETHTKGFRVLRDNKSKKRMLMTASPFYNRPSDIAPLVNIAAGENVFPNDPVEFKKRYTRERKVGPGFWGTLKGIRPGSVTELDPKMEEEIRASFEKWIDHHPRGEENFPLVERSDVKVPMTKEQREIYNSIIKKAPAWVRFKVRNNLPPSKQESRDLNAFMTGLRQVSLSTAPYIKEDKTSHEAKIQAAFGNLKKELKDPYGRVVVYSNYIQAGLDPYKKRLNSAKIPYGEFTGKMKKRDRDQMVQNFNEGKNRVLLLSSAGGEGLDLKGTSMIQVMEPHWNQEKIRQVEGRGIRYKSHSHLPKNKRVVHVQRYLAILPEHGLLEKSKIRKPGTGADEYLTTLSKQKQGLIDQFKDLLPSEETY